MEEPRSAADLQWFSSPCWPTGPPTVIVLPENVLQQRGRRRSVRDSVAADNRASAGDAQEAVPGDR